MILVTHARMQYIKSLSVGTVVLMSIGAFYNAEPNRIILVHVQAPCTIDSSSITLVSFDDLCNFESNSTILVTYVAWVTITYNRPHQALHL